MARKISPQCLDRKADLFSFELLQHLFSGASPVTLHQLPALYRPEKEKCSQGNAQMLCPVPRAWDSGKAWGGVCLWAFVWEGSPFLDCQNTQIGTGLPKSDLSSGGGGMSSLILSRAFQATSEQKVYAKSLSTGPHLHPHPHLSTKPPPSPPLTSKFPCSFIPTLIDSSSLWVAATGVFTMVKPVILVFRAKPHATLCGPTVLITTAIIQVGKLRHGQLKHSAQGLLQGSREAESS